MLAYEKAHMWRELFSLAPKQGIPSEELSSMGYRVAGEIYAASHG